MRTRTLAVGATLAALTLATAACGDTANTPAPAPSSSFTTGPHSGGGGPNHPVTRTPNPGAPAQDRDSYQPDCSGPDQGTVCTNPNHGAGDDPAGNGGAVMPNPNGDGSDVPCEGTVCTNPNHGAGTDPNENGGDSNAAPAPEQRDDDPGGSPCTTGMGVPGVYAPDSDGGWVCQIG